MGKESKIRELRKARIIPAVKSAKIAKPMAKGWRITIWSIVIVAFLLVAFGIWAYTKRNVEAVAAGYAITTQEVESRAYQMLQQQTPQDQFNPGSQEFMQQFEQAKQSTISQMISEKIFLKAAQQLGIELIKKDYEKAVDDILKNDMPKDPKLLNNWLKDKGFDSLDKMKNFIIENNKSQLEIQILNEQIFKQVPEINDVKVTEDDARNFYNANGQLKISHILFTYDPAKDPADTATKKKKDLEALRTEIMKDPTKFNAIAKAKSEDQSAKTNSGELGWYAIKDGKLMSTTQQGSGLVPEFNDAALLLSKGEVSNVVQTQFGFHLIKIDDTKTNGVQFDQTEGARIAIIKFTTIDSSGKPISDAEKKAKEAKANSILSDLQKGKITFDNAVTQFSDDQITKNSKGELPSYMASDQTGFFWATLDQAKQYAGQGSYPFEPSVVEAIWNLKNGQVAPKIIAGKNELVIAKLIEKRPFKKMDFEKVKSNVIAQLTSERKSKAQNDWMTKKREEFGVSMGNPWKSFSNWWQTSVVAPFEDFGTWLGKLMGKGATENVTTTTNTGTTPTDANGLPSQITPEMLQQLQKQGGGTPGQATPTPTKPNNP